MRTLRIVMMGLIALLLGATQGMTQSGERGSGSKRMDPEQLFNMLSQGRDSVSRTEVDPRMQPMFDRITERMNLSNGRITREQFSASLKERMNNPSGQGTPPPGATGALPPSSSTSRDSRFRRGSADEMSAMAESAFRQLDRNGDGYLNNDEMPEYLRAELDKWDTDHNGLIDLNEFKAFFQARMQQMVPTQYTSPYPSYASVRSVPAPSSAEAQKKTPLVYRHSNLPKELPSWFAQLDTNHDAQVALYEWKNSGRSLEEFQRMDRNGDGFLTVEEVLFYEAQKKAKQDDRGSKSTVVQASSTMPNRPTPGTGINRPTPGTGIDRGQLRGTEATDLKNWQDKLEQRRRGRPDVQR
jgi:Ca2+-binding EF-hand superfamily protein